MSENKSKIVVRLKTSAWWDGRSMQFKTTLTPQRRLCVELDTEELVMIVGDGIDIVNLNDCNDGLYELVVNRVSKDWETGYVDDWDYKLVPHKEENKECSKV